MPALNRNYQKLKSLDDFSILDAPAPIDAPTPEECPFESQMILRMLVRPKYGTFKIPPELHWLEDIIYELARIDRELTGIKDSWCYVTVRHGPVISVTDDEWHFDGASFRTSLIPERNYVWVNHTPMQYKLGNLIFPRDFDPNRYNLFSFAAWSVRHRPIETTEAKQWYLINPFCLHRRDPNTVPESRTFLRISFPDIEGRDINNTPNPLLETPAWGRDPVANFRNNLLNWFEDDKPEGDRYSAWTTNTQVKAPELERLSEINIREALSDFSMGSKNDH